MSALRLLVRSDSRIHGIITDGGKAANIIPDRAAARLMVRSPDNTYLVDLRRRVLACFEGAAVATATTAGDADFSQPYVHLGVRVASDAQGYLDPLTFLPPRVPVPPALVPPAPVEPAPEPAPAAQPAPAPVVEPAAAPAPVVTPTPAAVEPPARPEPATTPAPAPPEAPAAAPEPVPAEPAAAEPAAAPSPVAQPEPAAAPAEAAPVVADDVPPAADVARRARRRPDRPPR